jgi:hypothetical protein
MYVCGITPYDATHIGHAATYVTFDLLGRALRDAGHEVLYVQNVTDVDEPLLERAHRDGIHWQALADKEIALFREDMTALAVIAPDHYIGVVESVPSVVKAVTDLLSSGKAYRVEPTRVRGAREPVTSTSISATTQDFGSVSSWDRDQMMAVFAERGGDPERLGKHDELDPLLWRAARAGEPSWPGGDLGDGRPGWHIECTTIALDYLGMTFDVQGGGTDLVFPHHEMSAVQACGITGHVAVRARLRPPGHGRARRREDEQVQGQPGARLEAAALWRRPDGHPPGPAGAPLPHTLGVDRPDPGGRPRTGWGCGGQGCPATVARRPTRPSEASASVSRTTLTRRAPWPRWTSGPGRAWNAAAPSSALRGW